MKSGAWNVRSLYKAGWQLQKNYLNISFVQWEYRGSEGTKVAQNHQTNIHFPTERGITVMN
jgi:hypothetical protein